MLPTHCPKCNADFKGEEIPEKDREMFGNNTHFSRLIGIYDMYKDMATQHKCPDCGYIWDRFEEK